MTKTKRTNSEDISFKKLVKYLDAELAISDGEDHAFYNQFNKLNLINHVVVVYNNDTPIGCGGMKQFDDNTMEIKRMFTEKKYRGQGVASKVLSELEKWATELSFTRCVLETGLKQPAAMSLYKNAGFQLVANYGQYVGVENSQCFEKKLTLKNRSK